MITNYKSFNLVIKNTKSFVLNIYGFSYITSWLFSTNNPIKFVVLSMSFAQNCIAAINVRKVKITFSDILIKLYQNITSAINVGKIRVTVLMRLSQKNNVSLRVPYVALINILSQIARIISFNVKVPKIVIINSILVGSFNYLSVYDPQYLTDLDSTTLQVMDATYS